MPMLSRILAIVTLAAFVLLSAILQSTSPSTIHPVGILAVLILFYLLALGVLTFLMYGLMILFTRLRQRPGVSSEVTAASLRRIYYYATVLALAPVLMIGMRSIGRGTAWDIVLIVIFEIIACFYIAKR